MTASSGAISESNRLGRGTPDAMDKALRTAGGDTVAEEGRMSEPAGADEGIADAEAAAHVPLAVGEPMRRAVGPEQGSVGRGAGVPSVGLHPSGAGCVRGGEVRVGYDHLVAGPLETAGDPFTVSRGLDQD